MVKDRRIGLCYLQTQPVQRTITGLVNNESEPLQTVYRRNRTRTALCCLEIQQEDKKMSKRFNPSSIRLCRLCKKFRKFTYQYNLGHSACGVCKSRWGLKAEIIIDMLQRSGYDLEKVRQDEERK